MACDSYRLDPINCIRFLVCSFLCLHLAQVANCMFEDQVGKFDWRQQYIGKVRFAYIDPAIAGTYKFVVATDENVLACLSTRTGSIVWRQVLERGETGAFDTISEDGDLITVSGGGQFIRSWDQNTGVLQWETSYPSTLNSQSMVKFFINSPQKEVVRVEMVPRSHAKVSIHSLTRASLKTSEAITANWLDEGSKCEFISSHCFLCLDKKTSTLYLLPIKDAGSFIAIPLKNLGVEITKEVKILHTIVLPYQSASEKPYFGLQIDNQAILFQIQPPGIKLIKIMSNVYKMKTTVIENKLTFLSIAEDEDKFKVTAMELEENTELTGLEGTFKLPNKYTILEDFYILPYTRKDHGTSYKLLNLLSDYSIVIIHQQGRTVWTREEALSNIVSAEMLDLPLSEIDASIEQEFEHADAGVISMLLTRLKSQVYLLQTYLLNTLINIKGPEGGVGVDKKIDLTRDYFGLHKIIVVITKPGKMFGIDNLSGLVVWSNYIQDFEPLILDEEPYIPLLVQRAAAHFPHPPVCTVLGKHAKSKKSFIYSFNPITGAVVESKVLPYDVKQIMQTGNLNRNYLRDIILLDSELKVHIYPESSVAAKHECHYIFTVDTEKGCITGYSLVKGDENDLKAIEVWKVQLPQPIMAVSKKKPLEHVHSQGRVMGDRSVLYKYINPNLAAIFTQGNEQAQKTFCGVYLIDTITGLIVYSASHKRCRKPINIVHSENWLVYSYYNDKSRRIEISSMELFEGVYQSNTTAFSSFAPPSLPLVEHQTFIFPSAIEAMADTVTERGMTSKHLLIALPTGGILELPKSFLDPRRPINPLPEHREEGLIPYIPELPIMTEGIINYNQSVMNVKGIHTAPASLESTCLVLVYGLDLFYTRVTPSKTFDILKDDFDHYLISVVLLGLLVLSYTTKKLAARKTLRAAWK